MDLKGKRGVSPEAHPTTLAYYASLCSPFSFFFQATALIGYALKDQGSLDNIQQLNIENKRRVRANRVASTAFAISKF